MSKIMLIDAAHAEETRVVVADGNRIEEFDFESQDKKQLKGNIYLARVTRVEPSLQAAFVEYGGNRHGFLAFSEIHPDYYQIPLADRQELLRAEAEDAEDESDDDGESEERQERNRGRRRRRGRHRGRNGEEAREATAEGASDDEDHETNGDETDHDHDAEDTPSDLNETSSDGTIAESVEAAEMVQVRVRHQGVADAQQLARGQRRQVAEVEQQRPAAEAKVDEDAGIGERIVDQPRLDEPGHGGALFFTSPRWAAELGSTRVRPLHHAAEVGLIRLRLRGRRAKRAG